MTTCVACTMDGERIYKSGGNMCRTGSNPYKGIILGEQCICDFALISSRCVLLMLPIAYQDRGVKTMLPKDWTPESIVLASFDALFTLTGIKEDGFIGLSRSDVHTTRA